MYKFQYKEVPSDKKETNENKKAFRQMMKLIEAGEYDSFSRNRRKGAFEIDDDDFDVAFGDQDISAITEYADVTKDGKEITGDELVENNDGTVETQTSAFDEKGPEAQYLEEQQAQETYQEQELDVGNDDGGFGPANNDVGFNDTEVISFNNDPQGTEVQQQSIQPNNNAVQYSPEPVSMHSMGNTGEYQITSSKHDYGLTPVSLEDNQATTKQTSDQISEFASPQEQVQQVDAFSYMPISVVELSNMEISVDTTGEPNSDYLHAKSVLDDIQTHFEEVI